MSSFNHQLLDIMNRVERTAGPAQEPMLQKFFEENPQLLTKGEFIDPKIVISKLPIGGFRTDFAYIHPVSGPHFLMLIEIESSSKKIFTQSDQFTSEFNHALQQVHDWIDFADRHRDDLSAIYTDAAKTFDKTYNAGMLVARGVLVYGRRAETQVNNTREYRWREKKLAETFVEITTYDGLIDRNRFAFETDQPDYTDPRCVSYAGRAFREKVG